jgi:hypothetical protein
MGSIYFVDFILMHRLLGITKMLSVEYSEDVRKRVDFNKPFKCIETKIAPIGDVIPQLSKDVKHILWLDYDGTLEQSHLDDVALATTFLPTRSILLVTVDAEPPRGDSPKFWREYFESEGGKYFDNTLTHQDFARSNLPKRNIELINNAIKSGLAGRKDVKFLPMFNFLYKDGHEMLTIGGMIGTPTEKREISSSAFNDTGYYQDNFENNPYIIKVPRLTSKERQYLDAEMPCSDDWKPSQFELSDEDVKAYREIYRFCPTYGELLF